MCGGITGWLLCNSSSYGVDYEVIEKSCWDRRDNDCNGLTDENSTSCMCKIDNAYWSKTIASESDFVLLYLEGEKSCQGLKVGFDIKETSLPEDNIIKKLISYFYYPSYGNRSFSNSYWIVEFGNFTKDANYYFDVYPIPNPNMSSNATKNIKNISSKDFNNGILKVSFFNDSDGDGIRDNKDLCPNTQSYLKYYVDAAGCPIPVSSNFDIISWNNIWWGSLNWSNVSIHNFTRFEIGKKKYGKIIYPHTVDLRKKVGDYYDRLDLDSYIKIEKYKIELNEKELPMFWQDAQIIIYNVTLNDPVILKDGELCTDCVIISWSKTIGNVTFKVPHFTVYELVERTSLPQTPVQSPQTPSSGGGSGGGGTGGSSGGGGGGSISPKKVIEDEKRESDEEKEQKSEDIISEDDKELNEKKKIEKELGKNQILKIKVNDKSYQVEIIDINENGVEIKIDEEIAFILFGEENKFDITGDKKHDILINVEYVDNEKTSILIKPIQKAPEKIEFKKIRDNIKYFFGKIKSFFIKS